MISDINDTKQLCHKPDDLLVKSTFNFGFSSVVGDAFLFVQLQKKDE